MTRTVKIKTHENVQVNFNLSKEIAYWAKKYNITPEELKHLFERTGYSITQTIAAMKNKFYEQQVAG